MEQHESVSPKLDKELICTRAIALADEEGLAAVSMRALAAQLNVKAMSLYHHIANKEALLDAMVDAVVGEITLPSEGDWRVFMHGRAHAAYAMLKRHPWAGQLMISRVNVGPNMLCYVDATLGSLITAGFTPAQADHAWNAVDNHIYGFVLQEQHFPFAPDEYAAVAAAYLPNLPQETLPFLHQLTTLVAEKSYNGLHDFDFGLQCILDGLESVKLAKNETVSD